MSEDLFDDAVSGIAALADPLRRALYRFVAAQDGAVSRDQAAAALDVSRSLAATHLDRLAASGLLDVEFRRLSGRQGPGAGRPSKLYRRAAHDVAISLPARHYDLAADLLAAAVSQAAQEHTPITVAVDRVARDRGATLGQTARHRAGKRPARADLIAAAVEVLVEAGYEPRLGRRGIVLANCPFHRLAVEHTEVVCAMNRSLLDAMAAVLPETRLAAHLRPTPGRCCVCFDIDRHTKEEPT